MNNGCLSFLTLLFGSGKPTPTKNAFPYGLRDHFLSAAEISFYHVMRGCLSADVTIAIKPRLADILFVRQPKAARTHSSQSCKDNTSKPRLRCAGLGL
jgi:hypothetical protein